MKKSVIVALFTLMAQTTFAGKLEREFKKTDVDPAIEAAEVASKKHCGCGIKIEAGKGFDSIEDWMLVRNTAQSVSEGVEKYCIDEASKKAVCSMKSLTLSKGAKTAFTLAGNKGQGVTDGTSFPSFDMIMGIIDK